jgi:predicted acetyltransferase
VFGRIVPYRESVSTPNIQYTLKSFPATEEVDAPLKGWIAAEFQGFHIDRPSEDFFKLAARSLAADSQVLTAVYASERPQGSLGAEVPVATFASFPKSLTVAVGRSIPAHLISSVTVRPTHRRKGLLRRMMTDNLTKAHGDGFAVAALTVSEASIYRRFGFGPATFASSVTVDTTARFALHQKPSGYCELVEAATLYTEGNAIFAQFHNRTVGSLDRHDASWVRNTGLAGVDGSPDRAVRAAVHYTSAGEPDGYVTYKSGKAQSKPGAVEVLDLVAGSPNAYLGLWEFLASLDLVDSVSYGSAPVEDPLRFALVDSRVVATTGSEDFVWLRILDPSAALSAREYLNDGSLVLRVTDSLGFAAGTFRISVENGTATVVAGEQAAADISLDVSALGSLYLGGVNAQTLADAGQLTELVPGSAQLAARLFSAEAPVYCTSHF